MRALISMIALLFLLGGCGSGVSDPVAARAATACRYMSSRAYADRLATLRTLRSAGLTQEQVTDGVVDAEVCLPPNLEWGVTTAMCIDCTAALADVVW